MTLTGGTEELRNVNSSMMHLKNRSTEVKCDVVSFPFVAGEECFVKLQVQLFLTNLVDLPEYNNEVMINKKYLVIASNLPDECTPHRRCTLRLDGSKGLCHH